MRTEASWIGGPRHSSHSGSALDLTWLDGLNPADPTLVTPQGLLPYFQRDEVHGLIAGIAERLPGSRLVFDVVPEAMLDLVRRTSGRERELAVEFLGAGFGDDHPPVGVAAQEGIRNTPAQPTSRT